MYTYMYGPVYMKFESFSFQRGLSAFVELKQQRLLVEALALDLPSFIITVVNYFLIRIRKHSGKSGRSCIIILSLFIEIQTVVYIYRFGLDYFCSNERFFR